MKCLITGCDIFDQSHRLIAHGDLHSVGNCFVFHACRNAEGKTGWKYLAVAPSGQAVISIPFGIEFFDRNGVIVIPHFIAELNDVANEYINKYN